MLPTVLSGIQPTNGLHLGNYLGAIINWIDMQENYDCYFMMVDLHAITLPQEPQSLKHSSYFGIATYLACGLDPNKVTLFLQSHVTAHAQLGWILSCSTYMGELNRMTQFKDKSKKEGQNIPCGLYMYPSLMAADILLYQPDFIPVGEDQTQHIELTRDLAERVNNRFSTKLFKVPKPYIGKQCARVMDLQNPSSKMSKSALNPKGTIFLNDSDKDITKKVKSAVTDSNPEIVPYATAGEGLKNLMDIYGAVTKHSLETIEKEFVGKQYGHLKLALVDGLLQVISPIRKTVEDLMKDTSYLDQILKNGAHKAEVVAEKTLKKVMDTFGFIPRG